MPHPAYILTLVLASWSFAQDAGALRGRVMDGDFGLPVPDARIVVSELERTTESGSDGNWVLNDVPPGVYTVMVSKVGFIQSLRGDVVVRSGTPSDVNFELMGQFDDQEEFVVEQVEITNETEIGLLDLRVQSPSLIDSIGSELISQAGASNAGDALRLIPGATVQSGKYAVIRGLPDRYVNSQLNGIRLPTADRDKRAVELDQYPSTVIQSLQVSKTFTPDQQGDASGGAVNMLLKQIPDVSYFSFKSSTSWNNQASGRDNFLSYAGGGVGDFGMESDSRSIQQAGLYQTGGGQPNPDFVAPHLGALGSDFIQSPLRGGFEMGLGGSTVVSGNSPFLPNARIGANAAFFYKRSSGFFDDGVNDVWVSEANSGGTLTPEINQGGLDEEFVTRLNDITRASQSVLWGGVASAAIETDRLNLGVNIIQTRKTTDSVIQAINTRGRDYWLASGLYLEDPDVDGDGDGDPLNDGVLYDNQEKSPFTRTESFLYQERETTTAQIAGEYEFDAWSPSLFNAVWLAPHLTFSLSRSSASLYAPDQRQFAGKWAPGVLESAGEWTPLTTAANVNFGFLSRTWNTVKEESDQLNAALILPFELDRSRTGSVSFGVFLDRTLRSFNTFALSNTSDFSFPPPLPGVIDQTLSDAPFDDSYAEFFEENPYLLRDAEIGSDYRGDQRVQAAYVMAEYPIFDDSSLSFGIRAERTGLDIKVIPQGPEAYYFEFPGPSNNFEGGQTALTPGAADTDTSRTDLLPAVNFRWDVQEDLIFRSALTRTIARQTYKELTPLIQQEYFGGPIFIGNKDLDISTLSNLDIRFDWTPHLGGLVSGSWFYKSVSDVIETVQQRQDFGFTTATNYPEGTLNGFEIECRLDLGKTNEKFTGLDVGINFTGISSEVTLPEREAAQFEDPEINAPMPTRPMTGAPEYLANLFVNYKNEKRGSRFSVFYSRQGETLTAGAFANGSQNQLQPNIVALPYGTLNFNFSQRLGEYLTLGLSARNLLNPLIKEVYRSEYIEQQNIIANAYSKGIDFSISLSTNIEF